MIKRIVKHFTFFLMVLSISFAQVNNEEVLLNQIMVGGVNISPLESAQYSNNISQLGQFGQLNNASVTQVIGENVFSNRPKNVSNLNQVGYNNRATVTQEVKNSYGSNLLQNYSFLAQLGSGQEYDLNQVAGHPFKLNHSFVIQIGLLNTATANMVGSGNKLQLEQRNTGNEFALDISGNDNSSNVIQDGAYNNLSQYIEGNSKSFDVIQTGVYNELNQIETGADGINYSVHQKGPGMKVTIVNGSLR